MKETHKHKRFSKIEKRVRRTNRTYKCNEIVCGQVGGRYGKWRETIESEQVTKSVSHHSNSRKSGEWFLVVDGPNLGWEWWDAEHILYVLSSNVLLYKEKRPTKEIDREKEKGPSSREIAVYYTMYVSKQMHSFISFFTLAFSSSSFVCAISIYSRIERRREREKSTHTNKWERKLERRVRKS